jgi:DNA polymerase III epsilon subunit-like protein
MNLDKVFSEDYISFDLETSGLSKRTDDILQIGLVVVEDTDFIDATDSILVNPNYPDNYRVPHIITELTGITTKMINERGGDPHVIFPEVAEMLRDGTIVTHNGIAFDKPFLEIACGKYGGMAPWNGRWQDTAVLYKSAKLNELDMLALYETFVEFAKAVTRPIRGLKYNLRWCCADLGVDVADINWHDALADATATHRLFEQLREDLMGW